MNFKEWFDLNESFSLPMRVYEDIYNYVLDAYKTRTFKPRTAIPAKIFPLNLSGTRYEFLSYLNPKVQVKAEALPPDHLGGYMGWTRMPDTDPDTNMFTKATVGTIRVALGKYWDDIPDTIEHELLHFLQDLIKLHQKENHYSRQKKNRSEPLIGGLPKSPIVKQIMSDKGVDVSGHKNSRRTTHRLRPIEFYTNLNSMVNLLKFWYMVSIEKYHPELPLEMAAKDTKMKKEYFDKLLRGKTSVADKIDSMKSLNTDLYKKYMQVVTKDFLLNNDILDYYEKIKNDKRALNKLKVDALLMKKTPIFGRESRKIGKFNVTDFSGKLTLSYYDANQFSNLKYGNYAEGNIFLNLLGGKIKMNKWSDSPELLYLTYNFKKLREIFDSFKELREKRTESYMKCNVDYAAKIFAGFLARELSYDKTKENHPTKDEILNLFYPPPYGSCELDDDGKFIEES
jgi:hypothetical protein